MRDGNPYRVILYLSHPGQEVLGGFECFNAVYRPFTFENQKANKLQPVRQEAKRDNVI